MNSSFDVFLGRSALFTLTRDLCNLYTFCSALLVLVIYWVFFCPLNWRRKYVGNSCFGVGKKNSINRLRHARKIGENNLLPPYPNGWYSLLESSELKVKEVKRVNALGEHFLLYRTGANKVHVTEAYCPHLGADMGVGGQVVEDNIVCPFHLWEFNGGTGQCVRVPYSKSVPRSAKLRTWISKEVNDQIFVWYHVDETETPWELPVIEEIENKKYMYHGRNEFYVNCHIQEIPENGADIAHFEAVHNDSLLAGIRNTSQSSLRNIGRHQWSATWSAMEAPNNHMASVTIKHQLEFTKTIRGLDMNVEAIQIGPSYVQFHMRSRYSSHIKVLQTVVPIKPLLQKVVHRFYAPRIVSPLMKVIVLAESIMFERDMIIWNNKTFLKQPQIVREETPIKNFRKWYSQFYSDNSKPFTEASNSLEW